MAIVNKSGEQALVTRVSPAVIETIDKLAAVCGISRSELVAELVLSSLDVVRGHLAAELAALPKKVG
jgi:hypothetical protein